ncbi:unnamed protein product, partial [Closterium sp. NIES-54]
RGVGATVPVPPAPAPPEPAPPPPTPPGPPAPPPKTPQGSATTSRREKRGGNCGTDGKPGGDAGRGCRLEASVSSTGVTSTPTPHAPPEPTPPARAAPIPSPSATVGCKFTLHDTLPYSRNVHFGTTLYAL